MRIPAHKWLQGGYPPYFCGAADCDFRIQTRIGDHIIATIGDWHPKGVSKPGELAADGRTFEISVFHANYPLDKCDEPWKTWEVDTTRGPIEQIPYFNSGAAEAGHAYMCKTYAK